MLRETMQPIAAQDGQREVVLSIEATDSEMTDDVIT